MYQSYQFFAVKAYYNDLLWYDGTPNRYDWATNVARMVTESEIYFVTDFHAWSFFLTQSCSEVYSHVFCSVEDLPNPQISKLTQLLDSNHSVHELNCNEVTVARQDIACDIFNLLNHSFSSAFSQKWYCQRGSVSEKRMHFNLKKQMIPKFHFWRLHPDYINRDNGIEFPEAWIPTIKKHNSRPLRQQTAEGTTWSQTSWKIRTRRNNGVRNSLITWWSPWYKW